MAITTDKQIKFKQFLERYLLVGEKVLWIGQPKKGNLYQGWDFLAIPFWGWVIPGSVASIYGGVYSFTKGFNTGNFWLLNSSLDALVFILVGIVFLPVGFYMAFWRYVIKKHKINRTFYAVTDKRLQMFSLISGGKYKELHFNTLPVELNLDSIKSIDLQINRDGTGTLIFYDGKRYLPPKGKGRMVDYLPEDGQELWGHSDKVFAFMDISEARKINDLIEGIRTTKK